MATPDWNARQAVMRAFDAIKNAFRVLVINTAAEPIPVTLVTGLGNTTPTIFNVVCVANVENSQALPANTKSFIVKARNSSRVLFAYAPSATEFLTLNRGFSFQDNNFYTSQTIYFTCSNADTVEVVAYV